MLEAMAQAAALLAFDTAGVTMDDNTVYYFAGIDAARFKRPVEPGDQLVMDVELDRMRSGIYKFKGAIRVDGDVVCEAELMCTMRTVA
jgi:3-hydroxyacyl-[acyl-carrier-protein] dehydratase